MRQKVEIIFDKPLLVGECPTWDEKTKELLFVDIRGNCYYKMDYASGNYKKYDVPQMLGCLALCENGDLLLSMEDGVYRRSADGELRLAHQKIKIKGDRFNDGKVGPDGCYYVGTAGPDMSGAFYRLKGNLLEELFDGCGCSNGIDWTSDKKSVYYCDSHLKRMEKFEFDEKEHLLTGRKKIVDIPESIGVGDGMAVDADGNVWLAIWGGSEVWHIETSTGKILQKLPIPAKQVSSCCFAGDDMKDLIITTAAVRTDKETDSEAGKIFRYRAEVGGLPIYRFKEGK